MSLFTSNATIYLDEVLIMFNCNETFCRCRELKNHNFLKHYQTGGRRPIENRPINVFRRENFLTIFSINFVQHSNFYNFFNSEETVDNFLSVVENNFVPAENVEVQGSFSLINYQPPESEFSVEILD